MADIRWHRYNFRWDVVVVGAVCRPPCRRDTVAQVDKECKASVLGFFLHILQIVVFSFLINSPLQRVIVAHLWYVTEFCTGDQNTHNFCRLLSLPVGPLFFSFGIDCRPGYLPHIIRTCSKMDKVASRFLKYTQNLIVSH